MIKIITAIKNEEVFKELKDNNNIKIISNNIQYKEGILEILEKNKKINYIILNEDLYGQIKIDELILKIKSINNKIKIIIILEKRDFIKEEYLLKNKIKFIYEKNILTQRLLEIILNKKKIIGVAGNEGTGKTITTLILSELIAKYKNKKVLIVEDNIKNKSIFNLYKKELKETEEHNKKTENKIIKIKNKIYLLDINKYLINNKKDKIKIIGEINKIKNNYDYIFIDMQNINSYKTYSNIIQENLLILNPNILDINKIKKFIINNKTQIKTILNNYNENSISEKIIKEILKNKIKIIEKIENNKNYNLIINNNFNIEFIDNKTRKKYFKIINNM